MPTTDDLRNFERAARDHVMAITEKVYRPNYFIQLMATDGAYEAACRVVSSANLPEGFQRLLLENKPELTVEYLVTRPEWAPMFDEMILDQARRRLALFGQQ